MAKVTKDMTIAALLTMDPECAGILLDAGMHCIGCPASAGESIEEASQVHGIDTDELVEKLNGFFKDK
jgi:hydrid cluster protein-associated redox disulfide domain